MLESLNMENSTFVFMNNEIIAELDASGILANRYIRGHEAAALEYKGIQYGIHQDEQLSTGWLTGADGAVENACEYDAFGNLLHRHENVPNRLLYGGQQYDPEVRQYYLRARYYNPVVGRFTQEDPYRGDGLNLYAYCVNNPVTYYDPSGYECEFNQQAGENAQKENVTGSESGSPTGKNVFPDNPDDFLPEITRDKVTKPNGTTSQTIYPSDHIRIRAEEHPVLPGETYNPRHHGVHYHVEYRIDSSKSWNNKNNVSKVLPEGYTVGEGTGFLPGEAFPK